VHLPRRKTARGLLRSKIEFAWFLFSNLPPGSLYTPRMTPEPNPADIHSDVFLHRLMQKQLRLSIACAAAFFVALLGLPLLNYFFPEAMSARVAGFTISWLVLGVLFFPFVWIVSWVFIKKSIALEEKEAEAVSKAGGNSKH
jgi:uncharacterized membrane protein (DUF485 family)